MMWTFQRRRVAVYAPVLLTAMMSAFVAGAAVALRNGVTLWRCLGLVAALAGWVVVVESWRWICVRGDTLEVRSPFATRRLPLAAVAFGIEVRHSARGGSFRHLYATTADERAELGTAWWHGMAETQRTRLTATLLPIPSPPSSEARALVSAREQRQDAQQAEAQRLAHAWYGTKNPQRVVWIASALSLALIALSGLWIWWQQAG